MERKKKVIRVCTVPQSLVFVEGIIPDLKKKYELVLLSSDGPEWQAVEAAHPDVKCVKVNMARHISLLSAEVTHEDGGRDGQGKAVHGAFHDPQGRIAGHVGGLDVQGAGAHTHFHRTRVPYRRWL